MEFYVVFPALKAAISPAEGLRITRFPLYASPKERAGRTKKELETLWTGGRVEKSFRFRKMPRVNFSNYSYWPSLLCSGGEIIGYRNLSQEDKDSVVPIISISWIGFNVDFDSSFNRILESVGNRPFILDLDHRPAPPPHVSGNPFDPDAQERRLEIQIPAQAAYNNNLSAVLMPGNGFSSWRELVARAPNAVPVLQYRDPVVDAASILRQAARLSVGGQSIAIRVHLESSQQMVPIIVQILAILDTPDQLLILVDAGQGRRRIEERASEATDFLAALVNDLDVDDASQLAAVILSNSFTTTNHDEMRVYSNLDWRLWRSARESFPFSFGDYAATPRPDIHSAFIPPDSRPTVVFPLDESWLVYRAVDLNDPQGWIDGSEQIISHDNYDGPLECWGSDVISSAAEGDIASVGAARFWRAAKVNIHIHRQIRYSQAQIDLTSFDWDEDL